MSLDAQTTSFVGALNSIPEVIRRHNCARSKQLSLLGLKTIMFRLPVPNHVANIGSSPLQRRNDGGEYPVTHTDRCQHNSLRRPAPSWQCATDIYLWTSGA